MSVRAPVGPVNICNQKAIIGRGISVIRPLEDIYGEYLYYYFKANEKKIASQGTGSTFKAITQSTLNKLKVPIPYRGGKPDLNDQIRIATLLSRVETLIATRGNKLQQLDDFLKSSFLEMFGDPVRNDKGWDRLELSKFGSISTGNTPPRKDPSNYNSNYIEWIKTDNIDKDVMYVSKAREYLSEEGAAKGRILSEGAVLVACIAGSIESIGRAAITDRTIAYNQQINAIQPNNDVNSIFLYWLLKISQKYIQGIPPKGMKKIITKGVFEKIKLIKPPNNIQELFAKIAVKGYLVKQKYKESLAEIKNLYGALSQKAFQGELDLSHIPLPEGDKQESVAAGEEDKKQTIEQAIPELIEYPMSHPDTREKLLRSLFTDYMAQQKAASLSLDDFWQQASYKTMDMMDEFDQLWGADDYDQLKQWLYDMIRDGKLEQVFVEDKEDSRNSKVELTING